MHQRKPVDATAIAIMVVLCVIWGTQQAAIKAVEQAMAPLLQLGLRSGVSAAACLGLVAWRGEAGWLNRATALPGLAVGVLFGLEFVFMGEALRYTSASHATIFLYTAPLIAALGLGLIRPDERLSALQWGGIGCAFLGVVVAFAGVADTAQYPHMRLGDALAMGGSLSWAMTSLVLRGSRLANAPAAVTLLYQLAGAFVLACALALALGETHVAATPALGISLAYQAVVVAFASYLGWFTLLRHYSAARLGVLSFMTPVFGVAAGVALLGDRLSGGFIAGAALVMGGIITVSLRDLRPARAAPAPAPAE